MPDDLLQNKIRVFSIACIDALLELLIDTLFAQLFLEFVINLKILQMI